MSVGEPHIGWHDVSHTDVNEVARDQVFGREQLPLALAQHPSFYRQPLPQQGKCIMSPALLHKAKASVKNEQKGDDDSFGTLAQNQF